MIEIEHQDVAIRTFMHLYQTAREVMKYSDAYLYKKARLSVIKLVVLKALARNDEGMRPSLLAEWTQTERHNITALLDRMEREGMVATARSNSDRRSVIVTITDLGRETLERTMPAAKEIIDQVMMSMAEVDMLLLEKQLGVLRQNASSGLENITARARPGPV